MNIYKKELRIKIEKSKNTLEKTKIYFENYNYKFRENGNNEYVFFKKFSFLQGWTFNPLNWESEVIVNIFEDEILLKYSNYGNAHITPFAFQSLFDNFFKNLELYLTKSISFQLENKNEINKAKQKVLYSFLLIIIGTLITFALAKFLNETINFQLLHKFSIIVGALLSLKLINTYWIKKFT